MLKIQNKELYFSPKIIFWDFDGTIKDTIHVKAEAFSSLFENISEELKQKIKNHHLENGGLTREIKIPMYMQWVGLTPSVELTEFYMKKFADIVYKNVITSEWIYGVLDVIKKKLKNQIYVIITATPQDEIEKILTEIKIKMYFNFIKGHPFKKVETIKQILTSENISPKDALYFGDSKEDWESASLTEVPFILIKNSGKNNIQNYNGITIKDFSEIQQV